MGEYETDVFNIMNLILVSRKRREHLTPEQIHQHEQLQRKVESGNIDECDLIPNDVSFGARGGGREGKRREGREEGREGGGMEKWEDGGMKLEIADSAIYCPVGRHLPC